MKRLSRILLLPLIFSTTLGALAQTHREKITKEVSFNQKSGLNVLRVENIDGFVHVEPYNGDKVVFEVERIIKPKTEQGLRKAKEELVLEFVVSGDSIISFLKAPFIYSSRTGNARKNQAYFDQSNQRRDYDFTHNFTIKVPRNTNLSLVTVNNGEIKVKNVSARQIKASNVNGPVLLENITAEVEAKTINGDVVVTYEANPQGKSKMETLNGNVELLYKKPFSAVIHFSSFNGDFYTDLADLQKLAPKLQKTVSNTSTATTYKIDKHSSYKAGGGGAELYLKTFNGRVTVKERS